MRKSRMARGQAMVEFALITILAITIMLVGVQYAVIGQSALAISQMSYAGARYAAVNTCATAADIASYVVYVGSPTVTKSCGSKLTVSLNGSGGSATCSGNAPVPTTGCATPRAFGASVQVNISFDSSSQIFLPNSWFKTNVFPTSLSAQETAMSE